MVWYGPKLSGMVTKWSSKVPKWSGRVSKWSGRDTKWSSKRSHLLKKKSDFMKVGDQLVTTWCRVVASKPVFIHCIAAPLGRDTAAAKY